MKTSRRTRLRIVALIVAITAFLVSPELPLDKLFERSQRARLAAGKMIMLKFTLGERPLRVSQIEGGLIKIGREGKSTYTFSPTVTDQENRTVTIKVFPDEVAGGPGGLLTLVVEKTGDTYLTAYYADSDSSFRIEVIGVKRSLAGRRVANGTE